MELNKRMKKKQKMTHKRRWPSVLHKLLQPPAIQCNEMLVLVLTLLIDSVWPDTGITFTYRSPHPGSVKDINLFGLCQYDGSFSRNKPKALKRLLCEVCSTWNNLITQELNYHWIKQLYYHLPKKPIKDPADLYYMYPDTHADEDDFYSLDQAIARSPIRKNILSTEIWPKMWKMLHHIIICYCYNKEPLNGPWFLFHNNLFRAIISECRTQVLLSFPMGGHTWRGGHTWGSTKSYYIVNITEDKTTNGEFKWRWKPQLDNTPQTRHRFEVMWQGYNNPKLKRYTL